MPTLSFPVYDADQHIYETPDSFLRHLPKAFEREFYFADVKDPGLVDPAEEIPETALESSLTLALMRHGRPIGGAVRELAMQLGVPGGTGLGTVAVDWLGVPMAEDGHVLGALVVQSYDPTVPRYTEEDSTLLAYVAQHILTALARKQTQVELERRVQQRTDELVNLNSELKRQALHDALTQLPNRTLLTDRLQQAIRISARERKSFALVAVDLDLFKEINDTLG